MPRAARKLSESGIYHVMMRENDRQRIFLDEEDRWKWLSLLERYKSVSQFELFAYCLIQRNSIWKCQRSVVQGSQIRLPLR